MSKLGEDDGGDGHSDTVVEGEEGGGDELGPHLKLVPSGANANNGNITSGLEKLVGD